MTTVIVSQLILQVITEVINIREGGPAGYVKIKTSVPPPLFCPPDQRGVNNSCYIRVTTHFQEQDGLCEYTYLYNNRQPLSLIYISIQ
jgi:hypothetical protein